MSVKDFQSRVTLVFATVDRPHCVQRLIDSVKKYFPDIQVVVGNQGVPSDHLAEYYQKNNVKVAYLPQDAGVSAARNAAVELVETEYLLLADDDFIIGHDTSLFAPMTILDSDDSVDIVGGLLYDIYGQLDFSAGHERRWERIFFHDENEGLLVSLPIDSFYPLEKRVKGYSYFVCDAVMNWAVMRKNIFSKGAKWDEIYTCNGEHEDFYLNIKKNTNLRVVYNSDFFAYHHHPLDHGYLTKRERLEGWRQFGLKWNIRQYFNPPWGIQVFERDLVDQPSAQTLNDFLSRSASRIEKRDFVGVNFDAQGEAFIPDCTANREDVTIFVSKDGRMYPGTTKADIVEKRYSVNKFDTRDLVDVRNLSIHMSNCNESIVSPKGAPVTVFFKVRNTGKRIGVVGSRHKIMAGLKFKSKSGGDFVEEHECFTPLINDLSESSMQYVSFKVELPAGDYIVSVDLWLDYLGWMHIDDHFELRVD